MKRTISAHLPSVKDKNNENVSIQPVASRKSEGEYTESYIKKG